jgi:hypothetical protein
VVILGIGDGHYFADNDDGGHFAIAFVQIVFGDGG